MPSRLAYRPFQGLITHVLIITGAMCPCGYGTRTTSKRWARCKRCGRRCFRCDIDYLQDRLSVGFRRAWIRDAVEEVRRA